MRRIHSISLTIAALLTLALYGALAVFSKVPLPSLPPSRANSLPAAAAVSSPFTYHFSVPGILNEAGSMGNSTSPYWWLDSGGELILQGGVGETMQGVAPLLNHWRILYAISNPTDTDGGTHPQNLFRLITRSQWSDVSEEAQFYIETDNFSASPNHNASNGLLLMSRYVLDGQTLYYAGVRVDGTAVIKKKIHGIYYTMAQGKIFPGTYSGYVDDANLIPHAQWLGLRSETTTNADGSVTVRLYMQNAGQSSWALLLEATDKGQYGGTAPILGPGYIGIRTDFMDVEFRSFSLETI